jgi:2-polyprenyl-6-methoxyphenol hydroxylase-like FAD-dependent oxidoreductase
MLMKLWDPANDVKVFERNKEGVTHGWGVTMERQFLATLAGLDAASAEEIERAAVRWQDQVISFRGWRDVNRSNGEAYGVSRQRLLDILAARASQLGVDIRYEHAVRDRSDLPDADLIVAADGAGSQLRGGACGQAGFGTAVRQGRNKYIWLGTSKVLDAFHFFFEETSAGWIWAHAYRHAPEASTFVVECTPETWAALGFHSGTAGAALDRLEDIFGAHLDGHRLSAQFPDGTDAQWLNFRTVSNKRWHDGNVVLAGDSAHTAHFTVGLGTTLAIDDVIALAAQLRLAGGPVPGGRAAGGLAMALQAYTEQRQAELRLHATEAERSAAWFEKIPRYTALPPHDFATVLHSRRAPLLPKLPPRVFCQLNRARERFGAIDALRRLADR